MKENQQQPPAKASDLFSIDLDDLDFDLDDFDLEEPEADTRTRIFQPRLDTGILTQSCHFAHAMELAEKIDLSQPSRTFAWVGGGFIFGDIVEALWRLRRVDIKTLSICSLSISDENIDSWAGLMDQANIERFNLIVSAYWYSHEKFTLVPHLYEALAGDNRFQVAFGAYHCKLIALETHHGHSMVIHGSANMRSSFNIEQVMIEVDDRPLYDFNAAMIADICSRYGTVNHNMEPMTRTETREWFDSVHEGRTQHVKTKPAAPRIREHGARRRRR